MSVLEPNAEFCVRFHKVLEPYAHTRVWIVKRGSQVGAGDHVMTESGSMKEQQKQANDGLRRQIDENLRKVFQAQVEEGLPDRFGDLLARLRAQDGKSGSSE